MELALALEKLNFDYLFRLHDVAESNNDPEMANFVEEMLDEQVPGLHTSSLLRIPFSLIFLKRGGFRRIFPAIPWQTDLFDWCPCSGIPVRWISNT